MRNFKVGDKVVAINGTLVAINGTFGIVVGTVYTLNEVRKQDKFFPLVGNYWLRFVDNNGQQNGWGSVNFVHLNEYEFRKDIKKLLDF